ncbi:MAG: hypothetical protein JWR18_2696 [Segetibacter sp.]|nr:hypothetical protein [Segetibacter sp.]
MPAGTSFTSISQEQTGKNNQVTLIDFAKALLTLIFASAWGLRYSKPFKKVVLSLIISLTVLCEIFYLVYSF